jgi:AraC-like DNA-binding protein
LEALMYDGCDFIDAPQLEFEAWAALLRSTCGGNPEVIEPNAFTGWMHRLSVHGLAAAALKIQCGLAATDLGGHAYRSKRTHRDVRLAGVDWYCALFQVAGRSTVIQNEQAVQLAVGDFALADAARPSTYLSENGAQWLSLYLPRQSLICHLGFEPQACLYGRGGTLAARVLREIVLDGIEDEESMSAPFGPYMRLALYDLLGALFVSSDPWPISRHADKLFARICDIIKDRFANPDFGPCDVAAEAGISLRYLQKLFTARNSTCNHFIHSVRLDHATRLLHRRASLNESQPISEIAYASGYGDYTNFARKFRRRFGHAPGAHAQNHNSSGGAFVRIKGRDRLTTSASR